MPHVRDPDILPVLLHGVHPGDQILGVLIPVAAEYPGVQRGLHIAPVGVFLHHAVGVELGAQGPHGPLHHGYPSSGQAVHSPIVEQRDYLPLQKIVDGLALHVVLILEIVVHFPVADGPAEVGMIPFHPPAVLYTEIERTVGGCFHARGAAGFQRPPRVVQPDVRTLDQVSGDVHVVVFEEDDPVAERLLPCDVGDALDDGLAFMVSRMRLARDDDLHREVRVRDDLSQALDIVEEQESPLVGGEPFGESDGQGVRMQRLHGALDVGGLAPAGLELLRQSPAGKGDEPLPPALVR
ncbi:MAG: hypothetical protein BWZ01_00531 [Deltaproteobacteria bacterium ADurb.BinA179]|nr:MAG: hypothetical protein BWZ01_00531 [Deltaproteobacteria bacterium ADurb.BinA179]